MLGQKNQASAHLGDWPSGKAADFDSVIRGFESLIPNHSNKESVIVS